MALRSVSFPKLLWERIVENYLQWRMYAWKKKAVKRGLVARNLRKKLQRLEHRRDALTGERDALRQECTQLKKSLETFS